MMAYIQEQAKDAAGKWDIADVPGGGGNWGGSFLTVPRQSKNAQEAFELVKWLTAPEQQAKVFRSAGNFPSTSTLYSDAVIKDYVNPYFNNAPVGQIFSESVQKMKAQYLGPKAGDINTAIVRNAGDQRVELGKQKANEASRAASRSSRPRERRPVRHRTRRGRCEAPPASTAPARTRRPGPPDAPWHRRYRLIPMPRRHQRPGSGGSDHAR